MYVDKLKTMLPDYTFVGDEPMKVTIDAKKYGYTGCVLSDLITRQGIVPEFADPDYVVFMLNYTRENIIALASVLDSIPKCSPITEEVPNIKPLCRRLSPRRALMAKNKLVTIDEALGRVLAAPSVSCPPAVPIAVCGEVIDNNTIELFHYYGIKNIRVIEDQI